MTVDEAIALVLREGDPGEDAPEESVAVLLLLSKDFSSDFMHERIICLIEAIKIVHRTIEGQSSIDRRLASALYILGVGASVSKERPFSERERDDELNLSWAIQETFFDMESG